jgi:hypothetical protein
MSAPMAFLDFQIVGDRNGVQAMLARLDATLSPMGLSFFLKGTIGPWLRKRAADRFTSEGDDVTGKWAPLQPATQEIRARGDWPIGAGSPINKRTGELENYIIGSDSLVVPHTLGATLTFPGRKTTKRSVVQKMETAQKGRANPRTVPRPVLGMNERDLAYVVTMLAFHVKGGRTQ